MKRLISALSLAAGFALLGGCASGPIAGPYNATAHRPNHPNNVKIKVSLAYRAVYVMEGDRPLLVTATAIGTPQKPTPTGHYKVYKKVEKKRSYSYGFAVQGDRNVPTKADGAPGRYVGFPMAYWVEFKPQYGFHVGSVWPTPRTHGCLRLHTNVAPKFFALARIGTPVHIAQSQPEDSTIGRNLRRPTDYNDPDPPASFLISDRVFTPPSGPLLVEQ